MKTRKEYQTKAICPLCGEFKSTDKNPEQRKQGWECVDCLSKRLEPKPQHTPTPWVSLNIPVEVEQAIRNRHSEYIVRAVNGYGEFLSFLWRVAEQEANANVLALEAKGLIAKAEGK